MGVEAVGAKEEVVPGAVICLAQCKHRCSMHADLEAYFAQAYFSVDVEVVASIVCIDIDQHLYLAAYSAQAAKADAEPHPSSLSHIVTGEESKRLSMSVTVATA